MASKFFTNQDNNSLFVKFTGIASTMINVASFHAVCGFFRSSGYFKLRAELSAVNKIQILVGINIDNIFRRHDASKLWFGDQQKAKEIYTQEFINDIRDARYAEEIERGILQLIEDVKEGRLEMRIHPSKRLHAKFYLFLPDDHNEHSDGWVIMGSSNLTDAGLGITRAPQYELNVALKDFDDVAFCKTEFEKLWADGIPLSTKDFAAPMKKTHLGVQPTPFELYMKVLIDTFGEQIEDDFSLALPDGFKELSYQNEAVIQGYQMLCRHNGFFLADVVGLGKTVVAAMIARRFLEANGPQTKILVVYPPSVTANWKETFKRFTLSRKTQFVSNGSLSKVLNEDGHYHHKEEFDLVIVDESHNFRHTQTNSFNELQKICKSPRANPGNLGVTHGTRKKVMLLSATAVNNEPDDLRAQILLFQDAARSTIENIPNIAAFFAPLSERYKRAMSNRRDPQKFNPKEIDNIYEVIRRNLLERITVRRTRQNILNDSTYAADLEKQGIVFPKVSAPAILKYKLDSSLEILLFTTLWFLTGESDYRTKLIAHKMPLPAGALPATYARYRAIEFLIPQYAARYPNAKQISATLQGIYRVLLVKRLESSFHAFRCSLDNAIRGIDQMLGMFANDKVLIVPDIDIRTWLDQGRELDEVIQKLVDEKGYDASEFLYHAADFQPEFLGMLHADKAIFESLKAQWNSITVDPKLDIFLDALHNRLTTKSDNPSGKLVVFSESLDTINYLRDELTSRLKRQDILAISSSNRESQKDNIRSSFDANLPVGAQDNQYNILFTTDVLSEGINLHRANTVVHYDTPWNVARLMQRIGRVNRIGSSAPAIRNFMFYPSDQGNRIIGLYENALIKMQGFHSALGEDVQIFSHDEIIKHFKLFERPAHDDVDESLALLREARDFYHNHRAEYDLIKALPLKARCLRAGVKSHSVAFTKSAGRLQFYDVSASVPKRILFLDAVKFLRADPAEKPLPFLSPATQAHYADVSAALAAFTEINPDADDADSAAFTHPVTKDKNVLTAAFILRACLRWATRGDLPGDLAPGIIALQHDIANGVHTQLPTKLNAATKKLGKFSDCPTTMQVDALPVILKHLRDEFAPKQRAVSIVDETSNSLIVISETFIPVKAIP